MSAEAKRDSFSKSRTDPYSLWTCSLTRGERELGVGVIVRVEDEEPQSLLPCLRTKLFNQKVVWETDYALLTCHSNLDVVDGEPKFFNLKGLQASAPALATTEIALEDCVSGVVSCCGPTSMLMLSADAPAKYTLLPHTKDCPIGYDFVVLFLNKLFETGENNQPPVVNVSRYLKLASLRSLLEQQSGAQERNGAVFQLYSHRNSAVPVKVQFSKEQRIVKRLCDEIDWYSEHQRLKYSPTTQRQDSPSFNGAPIICKHEGRRYLVGISSIGEQVVTLYGICHLLAGGPVPLFAAMRDPSPRTLSPFRWSDHILMHLATMTEKGYLLEMFQLLVDKEEGASLVNLVIADTMNVSVSAMKILTEILNRFSEPEELGQVVKDSRVFESPNMSEDKFKEFILRVCKKLTLFMQHFSLIQPDKYPEKILESVFHCTEKMLIWSQQYPEVAECLLSNDNVEFASMAADKYQDSRNTIIIDSFKNIRQRHDKMVERDLQRMRQQIETLQKDLDEREQELKNKQRSEEQKKMQSEEEKERPVRSIDESTRKQRRDEILSSRPTIKMLKMLRVPDGEPVEIVSQVAPKWKDVGIFLDFDETGQCLDTIESGSEKDPVACCQAMFQHWLKGNGEEQTWEKLIEILKDSKLGVLADKVMDGLMA